MFTAGKIFQRAFLSAQALLLIRFSATVFFNIYDSSKSKSTFHFCLIFSIICVDLSGKELLTKTVESQAYGTLLFTLVSFFFLHITLKYYFSRVCYLYTSNITILLLNLNIKHLCILLKHIIVV